MPSANIRHADLQSVQDDLVKTKYEKSLTPAKIRKLHEGKPIRRIESAKDLRKIRKATGGMGKSGGGSLGEFKRRIGRVNTPAGAYWMAVEYLTKHGEMPLTRMCEGIGCRQSTWRRYYHEWLYAENETTIVLEERPRRGGWTVYAWVVQ